MLAITWIVRAEFPYSSQPASILIRGGDNSYILHSPLQMRREGEHFFANPLPGVSQPENLPPCNYAGISVYDD